MRTTDEAREAEAACELLGRSMREASDAMSEHVYRDVQAQAIAYAKTKPGTFFVSPRTGNDVMSNEGMRQIAAYLRLAARLARAQAEHGAAWLDEPIPLDTI